MCYHVKVCLIRRASMEPADAAAASQVIAVLNTAQRPCLADLRELEGDGAGAVLRVADQVLGALDDVDQGAGRLARRLAIWRGVAQSWSGQQLHRQRHS